MGAGGIGDINLNINVNVRGAAGLGSLNAALGSVNTTSAKVFASVNRVTAAAKQQQAQLNTVKGRLDYWEQQYDAIFRASYRLQNVGYGLINVSRKLFNEIKDLTDAWGKFEFTINRAAGALQIWKTESGRINPIYDALIEKVYSLSKELRLFPAEDIAKATYFWGSTTGQQVRTMGDLESVMKSVNPLMKIAALTETSYETAIKGVYSILVQYHRSLADVGDVTAKLFLVTQRTALEFPDLINAFKYVGPVAGALGVSFEEVAKTLGAIGDAGIRGTMAGRALRQMFIQTSRPTAKAKDILDSLFRSTASLGKSFEELTFPGGKFIGITGYVNNLAIALKNASVRDRQFTLASITTANELPVLTALVENQIRVIKGIAGAYDNSKSSVDDATNATYQFNKAWDLLSNSWRGIVGRLREGAEVIKLRVGRQIAEALAPTIEKASKFLDILELWVRRNPEIISALGSLAAGIGGLAAVGGALFILSGALLGLYAALNVIGRAFGPLLAVGTATLGTVLALIEAVVNNWTRIERTLIPAIQDFVTALTGGKATIESLQQSLKSFHEAMSNIANFIVKTAVAALTMLFNAMTAIVNSPLRPALEAIGKALVTVFAFKSFYMFLKSIGLITLALDGLVLLIGRFLVPTLIAGNAATKGFTLSLAGLRAAATALGRVPILVWVTLIVGAAQFLYDIDFLGIRSRIEGVAKSVNDLKDATADFYQQVGAGGKNFQRIVENAVDSTGNYVKKIADLRAQIDALAATKPDGRGGIGKNIAINALEKQIADLELRAASGADHFASLVQGIADDTSRSYSEIVANITSLGQSIFHGLDANKNLENAIAFSRKYFTALGSDAELSAKKAVTLWNDLIAAGVKPDINPETFLRTIVSKEELAKFAADLDAQMQLKDVRQALQNRSFELAHNILVGLKAGATSYSDDINAEINKLMGTLPATFTEVMDEVDKLVLDAPQQILDNLVNGFKSLGDVGAKIKAVMKRGPVTAKGIVKGLLGDITGSATVKALSSSYNELNLLGLSALDNAHTQFVAAVAAYEKTNKSDELAKAIRKQIGPEKFKEIWTGQFKGSWWKKLTTEQQHGLQEIVDWAATMLGLIKPTPATITSIAANMTSKAQKLFDAEFAGQLTAPTTTVDPIAELISGMNTSWTGSGGGKNLVDTMSAYITSGLSPNLYSGGFNTAKSWVDGIVGYLTGQGDHRVTTTLHDSFILKMQGKSPPPEGPLKNIDKGGYNIGKSWSDSLIAGSQTAIAGAAQTASRVKSALAFDASVGVGAMSFNANQEKTINVKVDVASKDGSVNSVDMRVLSESLVPELVRSLEHMAAVT